MAEQENSQSKALGKSNKHFKEFLTSPSFIIGSTLTSVLGLFFSILGALSVIKEHKEIITKIGLVSFSIGMLCVIIYAIVSSKKNKRLSKKIAELNSALKFHNLLKEQAYQGLEHTKTIVKITLNKEKRLYEFEFEKQFIIISDTPPIRYETQFYANKIITDAKKAKEYYNDNKIEWNKLNVKAFMSSELYPDEIELIIINANDNGHVIPFDIYFTKKDGNAKVELKKGMQIKLRYCYQVPIKFWGNYMNRNISYYNEPTLVQILYKENGEKYLKIDVFGLNTEGIPTVIKKGNYSYYEENTYTQKTSNRGNNNKEVEIEIRGVPYGRYRITWDAESYFGENEKNTKNGKDEIDKCFR